MIGSEIHPYSDNTDLSTLAEAYFNTREDINNDMAGDSIDVGLILIRHLDKLGYRVIKNEVNLDE